MTVHDDLARLMAYHECEGPGCVVCDIDPSHEWADLTDDAIAALGELTDLANAMAEIVRAAREAAYPMTPDGHAAPFMWKPANEALLAALARSGLRTVSEHS